jgi:hypothetical protein
VSASGPTEDEDDTDHETLLSGLFGDAGEQAERSDPEETTTEAKFDPPSDKRPPSDVVTFVDSAEDASDAPTGSWVHTPASDHDPDSITTQLSKYEVDGVIEAHRRKADWIDETLPALPPAGLLPGESLGEGATEPAGETKSFEAARMAEDVPEDLLGHGSDESTRAMSLSEVDDVLKDMERRVREYRETTPHDTHEELIVTEAKPREEEETLAFPAQTPGPPASNTELLETWIRKNAGQGVHFEPVGAHEIPRSPVRAGAALEIGTTHLRYLELQPYESGKQVVKRYAQVALATVSAEGPRGPEERVVQVTAGLAALRQRLGSANIPHCAVLHEQGALGFRVLTLPVGTRAVDGAVRAALATGEGAGARWARRVMGTVRVGTDAVKSVLVSYAPPAEIACLEKALEAVDMSPARITSARATFLETVITKCARLDEDAAEAFVLMEKNALTFALAARAVLLLARVIPLETTPGTPEWVEEVLGKLRDASVELERGCAGGELSRVRYLPALPADVTFPFDDIVVAFGRPAEHVDAEFLFRIDVDSVKDLSIPPDAVSLLAPAAYESTLGERGGLDLADRRTAFHAQVIWAVVGALALVTLWALAAWQPDRERIHALQAEAESLQASIDSQSRGISDMKAARASRDACERDLAAQGDLARQAPDQTKLLPVLGASRPEGTFFERLHAVRAVGRGAWAVELRAVGTGDPAQRTARGSELVEQLKKGTLADVTARQEDKPAREDEYPLTIEGRAGGDR